MAPFLSFAQNILEFEQRLSRIETLWVGAAARLNHHAVNRYAGSGSDAMAAQTTEAIVNATSESSLNFESLFNDAVRLGATLRTMRQQIQNQNLAQTPSSLANLQTEVETLNRNTDRFFELQQIRTFPTALAIGAGAIAGATCVLLSGPIVIGTSLIYTSVGASLSVINSNHGNVQYTPDTRLTMPSPTRQPNVQTGGAPAVQPQPERRVQTPQIDAAQRAYLEQQSYQRRLSRRVSQPNPLPAHVRSTSELIAEAQRALPPWHQSGAPSFDWGQFLIEAEAASSGISPNGRPPQPSLTQQEYDELLDLWQQGQGRAREAIRGITDPLLQARAVANAWLRTPMQGRPNPAATIRDCLLGRSVSSTCATKLIIASLHALPVTPPSGQTLAVQVFSGALQPVLFERASGHVTNIMNGIQPPNESSEVYESSYLDHLFLTEQLNLGHSVDIAILLNDLRLTQQAPQYEGPPARLRPIAVINEEIRRGLLQWRQSGHIPYDWASLSIEAEATQLRPPPSQPQFDLWQRTWRERFEQTRTALSSVASSSVNDAVLRISAIRDSLIRSTIQTYARDSASLITSMSGQGGNCQTSTQLLGTALLRNNIQPPPGEQFAIQVFGDHVQFVTYNSQTGVVWDILSNTRSRPLRGDLYHPALMAHSYLSAFGAGIRLPFSAESLLIARSQQPAEPSSAQPELARGMRNTLGWPESHQNFSPPGTVIPAFATIHTPSPQRGEVQTNEPPRNAPQNGPLPPLVRNHTPSPRIEEAISRLRSWSDHGEGITNIEDYRALFTTASNLSAVNNRNFNNALSRSLTLRIEREIQLNETNASTPDIDHDRETIRNFCFSLRNTARDLFNGLLTNQNANLSTSDTDDSNFCNQGLHRNNLDIYHINRLRRMAQTQLLNQRGAITEQRFNAIQQRYGEVLNMASATVTDPPQEFIDFITQFIRARLQSRPSIDMLLNGLNTQQNTQNFQEAQLDLEGLINGNVCRQLAKDYANIETLAFTDGGATRLQRITDRADFLTTTCEGLPILRGLRERLAAYQERINREPLATLAALSQVPASQTATPLIGLGRQPQQTGVEATASPSSLTVTAGPHTSASPSVVHTTQNNNYLHPLIRLLADPQRTSILRRPPPLPEAPASAPPLAAIGDGHDIIEIIVTGPITDSEEHPPGPANRPTQTPTPTPSRRAVAFRPGRIRLSLGRFTELVLDLDRETQDHELLRTRWTPEMTRFLANPRSALARRLRNQYVRNHMRILCERNPGSIPGPFGRNISRDLAKIIFEIALDDTQTSATPPLSPHPEGPGVQNSSTFWIENLASSAGENPRLYFQSMVETNTFIETLNSMFSREFNNRRVPLI